MVMVVLAFGVGWLVAGRLVRPLRAMTASARDISASNLHRLLHLRGHDDEFTELGQTLDDLFGRLEASFEAQRHFVANASHELRTPLTASRALLQVAIADPEPSVQTLRATCEELVELGDQQERLIAALLTLARGQGGLDRPEPLDLAHITRNVLLSRQPEAERRGIRFITALARRPGDFSSRSGSSALSGCGTAKGTGSAWPSSVPLPTLTARPLTPAPARRAGSMLWSAFPEPQPPGPRVPAASAVTGS
jgi:signal transduction histidine kinase